MIADSQPVALRLLEQLIRSFDGFKVTGAFSKSDDLTAAIVRNPPDLAIVDTAIRNITNACHALNTSHPRVRIVFLDRCFHAHELKRALECGAAAYFTKRDALSEFEVSLRGIAAGDGACLQSAVSGRNKRCPINPGLLTDRDVDVLTHLAGGLSARASAESLGVSERVLRTIRSQILQKVQLHITRDNQ